MSNIQELKEKIQRLPRFTLGCYPTPLTEAKILSMELGGPRIFVKRDDLSGLALGGNKCRQIEFLMGYAKEQGYDTIIYGRGHQKATQSNYAVQLISAARKAGIEVRIFMRAASGVSSSETGNDLLQSLMSPEVTWISVENQEAFTAEVMKEAQRLKEAGRRALVMQTIYKNQTPIEQSGWVNAAIEIYEQLFHLEIKADYIVIANSQGGSQSGLIVGTKFLGDPFNIIGFSAMYDMKRQQKEIVRMAGETARYLDLNIQIKDDDVIVYDDYIGCGYETVSKECIDAIRIVAKTEGIFLDPVYTGKAMAGIIDLIKKGIFTTKDTLVFIHTGGIPALFLHGKELVKE